MRFWHSPGLRAPPNTTRVFGVDLAIFQSTDNGGARRPRTTITESRICAKTLHTRSRHSACFSLTLFTKFWKSDHASWCSSRVGKREPLKVAYAVLICAQISLKSHLPPPEGIMDLRHLISWITRL